MNSHDDEKLVEQVKETLNKIASRLPEKLKEAHLKGKFNVAQ